MANEVIFYPVNGDDYAYELEGSSLSAGAMWIGYDGFIYNTPANGAIRVRNVTIPQGTSVNMAKLMIYAGSVAPAHDQTIKVKVSGIDEDNTADFEPDRPFGRTKTTANTTTEWGDTHVGSWIEIEVTSIVNEILGRGGWSSGNAMGIIIEDNGTAHDKDRVILSNSGYLVLRVNAEPNFTPTPIVIPAPTLPATEDWGIKISKPGSSVLDCSEEDLYYTTRRKQIKIIAEDIYTSTGAGDTTITHNLGYIPMVTVFGLTTGVGANWRRMPYPGYFSDYMRYSVNETNLYLHSSQSGEKFYYRIFIDKVKD